MREPQLPNAEGFLHAPWDVGTLFPQLWQPKCNITDDLDNLSLATASQAFLGFGLFSLEIEGSEKMR